MKTRRSFTNLFILPCIEMVGNEVVAGLGVDVVSDLGVEVEVEGVVGVDEAGGRTTSCSVSTLSEVVEGI